jgi:hypothetical protein
MWVSLRFLRKNLSRFGEFVFETVSLKEASAALFVYFNFVYFHDMLEGISGCLLQNWCKNNLYTR